jgi:hypothetical protein
VSHALALRDQQEKYDNLAERSMSMAFHGFMKIWVYRRMAICSTFGVLNDLSRKLCAQSFDFPTTDGLRVGEKGPMLFGPELFNRIFMTAEHIAKSARQLKAIRDADPRTRGRGRGYNRSRGGNRYSGHTSRHQSAGHGQPGFSGSFNQDSDNFRSRNDGKPSQRGRGRSPNKKYVFPIFPICECNAKTGGRLADFIENWRLITSDLWVLGVIQGYEIPLLTTPQQQRPPFPVMNSECLDKHMEILLEQNIVEQFPADTQPGFVSNVFSVPKPDGSLRLILNLKKFNEFVDYDHFKMEGLHLLRDNLQRHDYMLTIDLKDAFHHVPVAEASRNYLVFEYNRKWFRYTCLVFGLSTAPYVFTKIMKPVVTFFRSLGICRCRDINIYIQQTVPNNSLPQFKYP